MSAGAFTSIPQLSQGTASIPSQEDPEFLANVNLPSPSENLLSVWVDGLQQATSRQTQMSSSGRLSKPNRTAEEQGCMTRTTVRLHERLQLDQNSISHPDVDSPFADEIDVIKRLLPYHLYQQPKADLQIITSIKGKGKALPSGCTDIEFTRSALECETRRRALQDRWRKLKRRAGKRPAPDDQAYYLAQVVLDADRSENAWLTSELRSARTEIERLERERRATSNVVRMSQFSATPQGVVPSVQSHYYRSYPYSYTQAYGNPSPAPTVSTFSVSAATPSSTNYAPYQSSGAIPVQLPVASLPALHALGIIPVPAASLPPEGQPQPPAVLRGSTANGTILSLEINVSLLQNSQMSGLAMVLNSLVNRGSAAGIGSGANGGSESAKSSITPSNA